MLGLIPNGPLDHKGVPLQEKVLGLVIPGILQYFQRIAVVDYFMLRLYLGRTPLGLSEADSVSNVEEISLDNFDLINLWVIEPRLFRFCRCWCILDEGHLFGRNHGTMSYTFWGHFGEVSRSHSLQVR